MPAIEDRDRQQVENPQANAQIGQEIEKIPTPDWAEAPATLAMVIGPLKFFTESSPSNIFFMESSVSRLMVQVRESA